MELEWEVWGYFSGIRGCSSLLKRNEEDIL